MADRLADRQHLGADRIDQLGRIDLQPLEVQVQHVAARVVGEARLPRQVDQAAAQLHRRVPEEPRVHPARSVNQRPERHVPEHVALQIHAGRDLGQRQTVGAQLEDAALGDVVHLLALRGRMGAREGAVLDLVHELARRPVAADLQLPAGDADIAFAGQEGPGEHDLLRALADGDEAAGAGQPRAELRHLTLPCTSHCASPSTATSSPPPS